MKMYILVNKDITMSPAKLSAQVSHAVTNFLIENVPFQPYLLDWWGKGRKQTKIVLECKQSILEELEADGLYVVRDNRFLIQEGAITERLEPIKEKERTLGKKIRKIKKEIECRNLDKETLYEENLYNDNSMLFYDNPNNIMQYDKNSSKRRK